jgi:hypothetical protein
MTRRNRTIESETSIVPHSVATVVLEEASRWLGTPLPQHWARELIDRANTVYAHNARFRRTLQSKGNAGRDLLWAFARHWLCAMVGRDQPHLHQQLPGSYNVGHDLPAQVSPAINADRRTRATESWAAAAHFHALV